MVAEYQQKEQKENNSSILDFVAILDMIINDNNDEYQNNTKYKI